MRRAELAEILFYYMENNELLDLCKNYYLLPLIFHSNVLCIVTNANLLHLETETKVWRHTYACS